MVSGCRLAGVGDPPSEGWGELWVWVSFVFLPSGVEGRERAADESRDSGSRLWVHDHIMEGLCWDPVFSGVSLSLWGD